ncbi:MAG: TetR/AcrR family transcriptional regulator [Minicystis sp.]
MRSRSSARKTEPAGRVPPDARRRQLLDEAARIVTEQGIEHLQITEVAERAGVSRPLVYRQFPSRKALVRALLQDFTELVNERFHRALLRALPGTIESITTAFVEASCDAIEQRGAGPWLLLDARGADPELSRLGRESFAQLLDPWQAQLAGFIGTTPRRAESLLWVIVAAGRAALDGWIDGGLTRAEAVRDATVAVSALLVAFTTKSEPVEAKPDPPAKKRPKRARSRS